LRATSFPFFAFYSFSTEPDLEFYQNRLRLSFPRTRESRLALAKNREPHKKPGFLPACGRQENRYWVGEALASLLGD
jgi:hypothetical protein